MIRNTGPKSFPQKKSTSCQIDKATLFAPGNAQFASDSKREKPKRYFPI